VKIFVQRQQIKSHHQSGLTLVEMMVATTLLVVIMLGLTAMFNQTQRAFRGGLKQVDVFEGGRAVMDLIARDIEQATASKSADDWSFVSGLPPFATSLTQNILTNGSRVNFLSESYFLNYSTVWNAIGYRVLDQNNVDATGLTCGTLYRFTTNFSEFNRFSPNENYLTFTENPSALTNQSLTRIADGIVHFRLQFYDKAGRPVPPRDEDGQVLFNSTNIPAGVGLFSPPGFPNEPTVIFSNTLPAMVEVELGILEPQTLKQANSISDAATRTAYLEKQAGKVHIFRQQIPIRNAPR
jgi:hypothetical protein